MLLRQLYYSIKNYCPNIPVTPLGRWNLNRNIDTCTFLANRDHCGDILCGNTKYTKEYLEKVSKEKK